MRRWLHVLLAVLAGAALSLLLAAPASAHTVLVSSDPADGSRLAQSPAAVTLRFNEQVSLELGYLRVVDSSGRRVDNGPASHPGGVGSTVSVPLKSGLGNGSYLASYRVISADSHPVAGTIRYVVGTGALEGGGGGGSGSAPVDRAVSTGLALGHWLSFAGVGIVGGSWLVFSLWPAGRRRRAIRALVWSGWSLGGLGAVAEYLLAGPYAAGTGLSGIGDTSLLDASLHGEAGQMLSLRVLLLGVLGMVLTALLRDDRRVASEPSWGPMAGGGPLAIGDARPSWGPMAAAAVGAAIVITFAATGHTQSASPRSLWVLVDALHLAAMIVWLGGVVVLLVAALSRVDAEPVDLDAQPADLDADRRQLAAALPVFSRVAMGCVAILAVTGVLQAWREVGALDALTSTRYGQLVLVKAALFGGVLALGYLARRAVRRPVAEAPERTDLAVPVGVAAPSGGAVARGSAAGTGLPATDALPTTQAASATEPPPSQPGLTARSGLPAGLTRTLLSEVLVGALVLAATAVLISQPPGKVALAAQRSKPKHATVEVSTATQAEVEVEPGVHGKVRITVRLTGGSAPIAITATASLPARQLGPIPVKLQAAGPGSYTSTDVLLPAAGAWEISLTVRTSEFDSTVAVARVTVS